MLAASCLDGSLMLLESPSPFIQVDDGVAAIVINEKPFQRESVIGLTGMLPEPSEPDHA